MESLYIPIGMAAILTIWLMTKRWFWFMALLVGGLASGFACLASIIHFQIAAALGFFAICAFCFGIISMMQE